MNLVKHRAPEGKFTLYVNSAVSLIIPKDLWDQLMHFITHCKTECQWYNLIERVQVPGAPPNSFEYRIKDLFIPEQTAAAAEVESTPEQLIKMFQDARKDRQLKAAELNDIMIKARCWGHSHVEMAPIPSTTDDKQWVEMKKQADNAKILWPCAMFILNREGKHTSRIYDPETGYEFHNVEMWIDDPFDYTFVDSSIGKVTKKVHTPPPTPSTGGYNNPHTPSTPVTHDWQQKKI